MNAPGAWASGAFGGTNMTAQKLLGMSKTNRVLTIRPDGGIVQAARAMRRGQVGSLVVTDSAGRLVGLLTERDMVFRVLAGTLDPLRTTAGDVMTAPARSCQGHEPIAAVQATMVRRKIRHLPVVRGGRVVGMISARDVMKWKAREDREMHELTIFSLAKLAESRDTETGQHLERVREYVAVLARRLRGRRSHRRRVSTDFVALLQTTSALHDIGKVGIPDCILLKPDRLTDSEFAVMKTHTVQGAATLEATLLRYPHAEFLRMARDVAAYHHERWDGQGYPEGRMQEDIPLAARIFAVADVYDALVSKRVYKEAFGHPLAARIIIDGKGTQFDPDVVEAFVACQDRLQAIHEQYTAARAAA